MKISSKNKAFKQAARQVQEWHLFGSGPFGELQSWVLPHSVATRLLVFKTTIPARPPALKATTQGGKVGMGLAQVKTLPLHCSCWEISWFFLNKYSSNVASLLSSEKVGTDSFCHYSQCICGRSFQRPLLCHSGILGPFSLYVHEILAERLPSSKTWYYCVTQHYNINTLCSCSGETATSLTVCTRKMHKKDVESLPSLLSIQPNFLPASL